MQELSPETLDYLADAIADRLAQRLGVPKSIEPSRPELVDAYALAGEVGLSVQSSYHNESQRDRPELANRTQDVTILQSKLVSFGVRQLKFRTVAGEDLEIEDVKTRLKTNPLVLMLPVGASIHPQFVAALNPDTIVVTRATRRSKLQRLVPRPDSE